MSKTTKKGGQQKRERWDSRSPSVCMQGNQGEVAQAGDQAYSGKLLIQRCDLVKGHASLPPSLKRRICVGQSWVTGDMKRSNAHGDKYDLSHRNTSDS